ncbi:MAG: hypothetical protein ACM3KM_03945 [Acidobacteriaceae bacterium]
MRLIVHHSSEGRWYVVIAFDRKERSDLGGIDFEVARLGEPAVTADMLNEVRQEAQAKGISGPLINLSELSTALCR